MPERLLLLACGALAREALDIVRLNRLSHIDVEFLPARLHNTPREIPDAVAARLERVVGSYDRVLVGYADCGTGGRLDRVLDEWEVERLPGAHCYEFFAGHQRFDDIHERDPATFYLTDFLAKHFDRLVWRGLGLDRHPQLRDAYFGNYRRVVYLAQVDDPELTARAQAAAARLGLEFQVEQVGYGDLEPSVVDFARPVVV